jgi:hypothetical protein
MAGRVRRGIVDSSDSVSVATTTRGVRKARTVILRGGETRTLIVSDQSPAPCAGFPAAGGRNSAM